MEYNIENILVGGIFVGANGQTLGAKKETYDDFVDLKLQEVLDRYKAHNIDINSINATIDDHEKKKKRGTFGVEGDERFKRQFEELGTNAKLFANTSASEFTRNLGGPRGDLKGMVGKTYALNSNMLTTNNGRSRATGEVRVKISAGRTTKTAVGSSGRTVIARGTDVQVTRVYKDKSGRTVVQVKTK